MKEQYFNPDSIKTLANDWFNAYTDPAKANIQPFRIETAALLVLDMQRYFLDPKSHAFIPSSPFILERLYRIADYFVSQGRPVIATQHVNEEKDAGRMDDWWSELITTDHPLVDIDPGLKKKTEKIFSKPQYDAFYKTDLFSWLESKGIKQLVIGGVMTHLCCETTARSAFIRGYEVFFLIDGTATYNKDFHQASLQNLAHGFALLTSVDQLLGED